MTIITITILPNGPYLVTGLVKLVDVDGNELPLSKRKVALCRCGNSANNPFCDGAHTKINFRADTKAC